MKRRYKRFKGGYRPATEPKKVVPEMLGMCDHCNKAIHGKTGAKAHLEKLQQQVGYIGSVYECKAGNGWHVGSSGWQRAMMNGTYQADRTTPDGKA